MDTIIEELLLRSLVSFLLIGAIAGVMTGALLLWRPERLRHISGILNRWISTRQLDGSLERSISIDPWFYRHRYISAVLILLSSLYILYCFVVGMDRDGVAAGIARRFVLPLPVAGGLLDALVLTSILGSLLALFVSIFLLMRPSLLRDFELFANQWVSLRRAMKLVELPRAGIDEYVFRHGRKVGVGIIIGSLYVIVLLTTWISH
jgi:hypothetical protein